MYVCLQYHCVRALRQQRARNNIFVAFKNMRETKKQQLKKLYILEIVDSNLENIHAYT